MAVKQAVVQKKEIVKAVSQAAITEIPDYLLRKPGVQQAGFEEVEQGDLTVPQMRLCQSLTPQRQQNEAKFIASLKEGEYFNTVTSENYGSSVKIVPLMFFKNRVYFRDKKKGGGILCRSDDMKQGIGEPGGECAVCPLNQFGSAKDGAGKGKACTEFFNFPSMVVSKDGSVNPNNLVVRSFKSSGITVAKDWLAMMRLRGIDMFGGIYELGSTAKVFTEGTSYVETVKNAGVVSKETLDVTAQMYAMFSEMRRAGRVKIHEEEVDEPGASDESNA